MLVGLPASRIIRLAGSGLLSVRIESDKGWDHEKHVVDITSSYFLYLDALRYECYFFWNS